MFGKSFFLQSGLLMMATFAAAQKKPFSISGTIKGKTEGYVYLAYKDSGYDSAVIENEHFSFKGELSGPVQATVTTDRNSKYFDQYAQLFIVPGKMQLSLDCSNFSDGAVLKGSPVQAEADQLKQQKASVMQQIKPLSDAYDKASKNYSEAIRAKKDEATLSALKDKANNAKDAMEPYYKQIEDIDKAFMDKHPASYVTASIMRYRISGMQLQEAESRYNKLANEIKNSALGKELKKELDGLRMGSPGYKAYVFSSRELRGEPLSLADYKGQYVLLDFWASWCVPCRKGNPHLLSLYKKYKDKGFEIIGISDDDSNHDAWKKAVKKDGIGVWKHVLRGLKYNGNGNFDRTADISDHYGIHTLPTKILIGPNGIIIGRYGGGGENDEAMDKMLSEIFGN